MRDKVLKLCRRLKKCTLDDLISLTESSEEDIKTAVISLENDGESTWGWTQNSLVVIDKDTHTRQSA